MGLGFSGCMSVQMTRFFVFGIAVSLAAARSEAAQPQVFPTRPLRLIVSNLPGSAPDVVARIIAVKVSETWGQQIVIDNRAGATGLIAAETLARAAPDGYTMWLNTMTQLISTLQAQRLMLAKDFASVTLVASTPFVIVVGSTVPAKTLAEWISYARARPGQLIYGSAGQWGSSHLCMEAINSLAGLSLTHVPYKGSTVVLADLVAGRIHVYCPAAPSLPVFSQSGKVRAIAMTYQKPSALVPGLVPVSETLPGFELLGWYGLQVPLQTPKQIIAAINTEFVKALRSPEIQEKLNAVGAEAVGSSTAELDAFLRKETDRWEKVLRSGGAIPPAVGR